MSNEGGRATEFENVNSKQKKLRMHREKEEKNIHEAADTSSRSPQQEGAGRKWGGWGGGGLQLNPQSKKQEEKGDVLTKMTNEHGVI